MTSVTLNPHALNADRTSWISGAFQTLSGWVAAWSSRNASHVDAAELSIYLLEDVGLTEADKNRGVVTALWAA